MNIHQNNGGKANLYNALNIVGWNDTNLSTDYGSNGNFNNIFIIICF